MYQRTLSGGRAPLSPFRDDTLPPRYVIARGGRSLFDVHQRHLTEYTAAGEGRDRD